MRLPSLLGGVSVVLGGGALVFGGYQSALLAAAFLGRARRPAAAPSGLRFVAIVPAHDEQVTIRAAVRSLVDQRLGSSSLRLVVVADNCSDGTAAVAADAGAEVWTRTCQQGRGKGQALAWALEKLSADESWDAVLMMDADCVAGPGLVEACDRAFSAGMDALQCRYSVANPDASAVAALRYAGFALTNEVEPRGRVALGGSAGLYGSGMAFTRGTLDRVPWTAGSVAEDAEYHLLLVRAGIGVGYLPDATVASPMPTTHEAAVEQQRRWEGGRVRLVRQGPALVWQGLRQRDPRRVMAGADLLVPPQSLTAAAVLGGLSMAVLARSRAGAAVSGVALGTQAASVVGGLALVGAPGHVYLALLSAPRLVLQKLLIFAGFGRDGTPASWVRTDRASNTSVPQNQTNDALRRRLT